MRNGTAMKGENKFGDFSFEGRWDIISLQKRRGGGKWEIVQAYSKGSYFWVCDGRNHNIGISMLGHIEKSGAGMVMEYLYFAQSRLFYILRTQWGRPIPGRGDDVFRVEIVDKNTVMLYPRADRRTRYLLRRGG